MSTLTMLLKRARLAAIVSALGLALVTASPQQASAGSEGKVIAGVAAGLFFGSLLGAASQTHHQPYYSGYYSQPAPVYQPVTVYRPAPVYYTYRQPQVHFSYSYSSPRAYHRPYHRVVRHKRRHRHQHRHHTHVHPHRW